MTPLKFYLARIFLAIQISILFTILIGDSILGTFGIKLPKIELLENMKQNKFGSCIFVWMIGNMLISSMSNSGAFEIAYDGQMVFSKLDAGRMPNVNDIIEGINQIKANAQ